MVCPPKIHLSHVNILIQNMIYLNTFIEKTLFIDQNIELQIYFNVYHDLCEEHIFYNIYCYILL